MTFKDQAAADLSVFVNTDEFADSVVIDGDTVACVREGNGDTEGDQDGVINVDTVFYCRAADFYKLPVVGQRLAVGAEPEDRPANVVGVNEDQGMLTLRLRWMDS